MRLTVTTTIVAATVLCAFTTNVAHHEAELATISAASAGTGVVGSGAPRSTPVTSSTPAQSPDRKASQRFHAAPLVSEPGAATKRAIPSAADYREPSHTAANERDTRADGDEVAGEVTVNVGDVQKDLEPEVADDVVEAVAKSSLEGVDSEVREGQLGSALVEATAEAAQQTKRVSGFVLEAISEDPTDPVASHTTFKGLANATGPHELPQQAAEQLSAGQTAVIGYDGYSLSSSFDAKVLMTATPSGEQLAAAQIAGANSAHQVTIVMVLPPGGTPDGTTPDQLRGMVAGQVAPFWKRQTGGALDISVGAVQDWTPLTSDCASDPFAVWAEAVGKIGWQGTNTDHLLLYIPQNLRRTCGVGLGTVGTSSSGAYAWVSGPPRADVAAHEIGHNLGLGHANSLVCKDVTDAAYSKAAKMFADGCVQQAYGDYSDVMGVSHGALGSLSQLNQHRLGVDKDARTLVTTSGVTRVKAAHTDGGVKGIVIEGERGKTYFIEYRTETGENNWLRSRGIDEGLQVRKISPVSDNESLILDSTPSGNTADRNVAITSGQSLVLDGVTVTLRNGSTSDYADVEVRYPGEEPAADPKPRQTEEPKPIGEPVKHSAVFVPAPPAEKSTSKVPQKNATGFAPKQ